MRVKKQSGLEICQVKRVNVNCNRWFLFETYEGGSHCSTSDHSERQLPSWYVYTNTTNLPVSMCLLKMHESEKVICHYQNETRRSMNDC